MTSNDSLARRVDLAVESLYEDERLRSELVDEEATALLQWAELRLEEVARRAAGAPALPDPEALFDSASQRIRTAVREINDLVGGKDRISEEDLRRRLESLLSPGPATAFALPPAAEDLVRRRKKIDRRQFLRRLTSLVDESWRIAGGSRRGRAPRTARQRSSRSWLILGAAAILLVALLVLVDTGYLRLPSSGPTPEAAPPAGWYQVFFTAPRYPDNAADHKGGLDEKLTAFIDEATSSVDVAIYQLDLENVTRALLNARSRNASVRAVTDVDILDDPQENPSFQRLRAAGVTVVGGNSSAIMHDKFVVVDRKAVWTGSWNFTENDTYRYNNNGLLLRSPELARNYAATFEKMWRDKQFGAQRKPGGTTPRLTIEGVAVESYFAPEDRVAAKILPRLKIAQKSIDFMAFSFTDDTLGTAVRDQARAGVKVRGVFENTGSETRFSEYGRMKADGLDVLQDGNPYLMHHKVFVIDGTTVVVGSYNFSRNADTANDENLLIFDDQSMAAQFTAEFERVYAQAKNPPRK